jgi:hypothetical protein
MQTYDAKIKHNDSIKDLTAPDGFVSQNKARRIDTVERREETVNEEKNYTSKKKKKIRFTLQQSKIPDDRDDKDE